MGQSVELSFPPAHAVRIEYPGYVEDTEAAVATLGGTQGLQQAAMTANALLPLKFRPADALCRPLVGEKCSVKGLLVSVRKSTMETSEEPIKVEAVARVNGSYRFSSLADLQYVADSSLAPTPPQGDGNLLAPKPEPLLTVPPFFVKHSDAINYQFRSYYGSDPPSMRAQGAGRSRGQLPPHVFKFATLKIPPAIADPDLVMVHYGPQKWETIKELRRLFERRPVWGPLALQEQMQTAKVCPDTDILAKLAYTFRSGPFAHLWIRRGYDPRTNSASCGYQGTTYTLPATWASRLRNLAVAETGKSAEASEPSDNPPVSSKYSELTSFQAVPRVEAVVQLCDIQDAQIEALVSNRQSLATACTAKSGWLQQEVWERIVARIRSCFQALLDSTTSGHEASAGGFEKASIQKDNANGFVSEAAPDQSTENDLPPVPTSDQQPDVPQKGDQIVPEEMMSGLLAGWTDSRPELQLQGDRAPAGTAMYQDEGDDGDEFEIFEAESEEQGSEMDYAAEKDGAEEEDDIEEMESDSAEEADSDEGE